MKAERYPVNFFIHSYICVTFHNSNFCVINTFNFYKSSNFYLMTAVLRQTVRGEQPVSSKNKNTKNLFESPVALLLEVQIKKSPQGPKQNPQNQNQNQKNPQTNKKTTKSQNISVTK